MDSGCMSCSDKGGICTIKVSPESMLKTSTSFLVFATVQDKKQLPKLHKTHIKPDLLPTEARVLLLNFLNY